METSRLTKGKELFAALKLAKFQGFVVETTGALLEEERLLPIELIL